jgi:hypothetical protein
MIDRHGILHPLYGATVPLDSEFWQKFAKIRQKKSGQKIGPAENGLFSWFLNSIMLGEIRLARKKIKKF